MKRLALALLLTSCTHGGIHTENDIFDNFNHNNDRYYTHGTRFDYREGESTYSIGQNIYTPSDKHATASPELLSKDRPYTGWLYGEYRNTHTNFSEVSTTYGIQLGCLGPCSFAKETQQEIHKLLGQGIPAWVRSDTLRSEPGFILEYEKRKLIYGTDTNDLTVYGLGKFGNIIDSASLGATYRLGFNIDKSPVVPIVFKVSPEMGPKWRFYIFSTLEERAVLYNHLLEGSLFRDGEPSVDPERLVTQIDLGVTIGYEAFRLSYIWSHFSPEWTTGAPFAFAGINIDW